MKQKLILTLTLITIILIVSACGWRLRGTLTLPEGLEVVQVISEREAADIAEELRDLLKNNNVQVTDNAAEAQLTIKLNSFSERRRATTLGNNTLITEYELISEARFDITRRADVEQTLLDNELATSTRSYDYDENDVASSNQEQRLLQREMRLDVAQQIVRRLRFLPTE